MKKLEVAQRMHISAKMSLGWRWVGMKEMAHALWEGHTLLKTGLSAHRQTDRQTKVKTVYPPVSWCKIMTSSLHGVLWKIHFASYNCYIFCTFLLKPHFDLEPD